MNKKELIKMSECKTSKIIKKGKAIFDEGDYLNGVFCIKSGICKLTKLSSNGKIQIVKFIKRGDLLGQKSVISDVSVNLSAIAIDDMEVCFIPKKEILSSFKNNKDFSFEIVKDICYDLRLANEAIVNMAQKSVKERLAKTLLLFNDEFGINEEGFLKIQLTREDIANAVGTVTESLIRILSSFNKEGLLEIKGKKIKILNLKQLQRLSEGF